MNGMTFGTEGPMMTGTWYNPNNGDAFTVRDSFFEDNQYIVTTTDGRYLRYEQLQNYIQTDMNLEDLKKRKAENQVKQTKNELPAEVANIIETESENSYNDYLLPDENILTRGLGTPSLGNIYESKFEVKSPSPTTMNEVIIEKALKNAPKPEITVNISWDVYPEKQIEMLKDVMEIPEIEIVDWYLNNIDMLEVAESLKTAIREKILIKDITETQDLSFDINETNTLKKTTKRTKKSTK